MDEPKSDSAGTKFYILLDPYGSTGGGGGFSSAGRAGGGEHSSTIGFNGVQDCLKTHITS